MYERIEINQFEGLNSDLAVSPKPDVGLAKDINNLRIEKLGKLVSRNGQEFGAYIDQLVTKPDGITMNNGAIAIGELTLPGVPGDYPQFGTTRFMVYYLRYGLTLLNNEKDENDYGESVAKGQPKENLANFVLCPLDGPYQDRYVDITAYMKDADTNAWERKAHYREGLDSQGQPIDYVHLYAPNKLDPATEDFWIDQYAQMNQYRNKLIVSDRINGDMMLFDRSELDNQDQPAGYQHGHNFAIEPNCKTVFDINAVQVDYRFEQGQENSQTDGVEHGMALYNYSLPKKVSKPLSNPCEDKIANASTYGEQNQPGENVATILNKIPKTAFLTDVYIGDTADIDRFLTINTDKYYCFSNHQTAEEFNDIQGALEFAEEKYIDPDTQKEYTSKGANTYIWEDMQINYFPSNGIEYDANNPQQTFLKEIDKIYDKLVADLPKAVKFETKDKYGKRAPVGGWRYKFVWDLGNGDYSVASTELLVPDILWSATQDLDMINSQDQSYKRPLILSGADWGRTYDRQNQHFAETNLIWQEMWALYNNDFLQPDGHVAIYHPQILVPDLNVPNFVPLDGQLTKLGLNLFKLKSKLYGVNNHKYGTKDWFFDTTDNLLKRYEGGVPVPVEWKDPDARYFGDFMTMMTVQGNSEGIKIDSPIYEIIFIAINHFSFHDMADIFSKDNHYHSLSSRLRIPLFPDPRKATDMYSMFSSHGNLKRYAAPYRMFGAPTRAQHSDYSVSFPFAAMSDIDYADKDTLLIYMEPAASDRITLKEGVDTGYLLYENSSGFDYWGETPIKGILKATDDLAAISIPIPSDVISRLVLDGIFEEPVMTIGTTDINYHNHRYHYYDLEPGVNLIYTHKGLTAEDFKGTYDNNIGYYVMPDDINNASLWNPFQERKAQWLVGARHQTDPIENVDVYVYLPASRFIGLEQLTSYFPSSALFKAPRMGFRIPTDLIPTEAKRLLVFRTQATLNNSYEPNSYGYVTEVPVERFTADKYADISIYDDNGNIITPQNNRVITDGYVTQNGDAGFYDGLYVFDDVVDELIDFSQSPSDYNGLYFPIHSRFNININETMFYGNFIETYQPLHARSKISNNINYNLVKGDEGHGDKTILDYKILYEDENGIKSKATDDITVSCDINSAFVHTSDYGGGNLLSVVFFFLTSPYDTSIKYTNIYRKEYSNEEYQQGTTYSLNQIVYVEVGGNKTYYKSTADSNTTEPTTGDWIEVAQDYYLIKQILMLPETEGIFTDNGIPNGIVLANTDPVTINYESGVRWSEPYQPNWIKFENFVEYGSGDGSQITGLTTSAGNLVVFKEDSFYRSAIQGEVPPISRTDVISQTVGCIAPNSLLSTGNMVYFLSQEGFKVFDNNTFKNLDMAYNSDLMFILKSLPKSMIRDITSGYNPTFNEIYLNIPLLENAPKLLDKYPNANTFALAPALSENWLTNVNESYYYPDNYITDHGDESNNLRSINGHIYVHGMNKGYVTKFSYPASLIEGSRILSLVSEGNQVIRLYHVDSDGNMRSAEIMPRYYNVDSDGTVDDESDKLWAGIYIETPYRSPFKYNFKIDRTNNNAIEASLKTDVYNSYDVILDASSIFATRIGASFPQDLFPVPRPVQIPVNYETLFQDLQASTVIKRLRKVLLNIYAHDYVQVIIRSYPYDAINSGISKDSDPLNESMPFTLGNKIDRFTFNPTVDTVHPLAPIVISGTQGNILEMTLETVQRVVNSRTEYQDDLGKPVMYSIEIYTGGRTQLNGIVTHLRPIWRYLM